MVNGNLVFNLNRIIVRSRSLSRKRLHLMPFIFWYASGTHDNINRLTLTGCRHAHAVGYLPTRDEFSRAVMLEYMYLGTYSTVAMKYNETWELGTPKGLRKSVLNSEVVLFLRSITTYWIRLGTEAAVLNSQRFPISQVVLKTGFTVLRTNSTCTYRVIWADVVSQKHRTVWRRVRTNPHRLRNPSRWNTNMSGT